MYNKIGDVMSYTIGMASESTPPHAHKFYQIIICLKGSCTFHASDGDVEAVPGTIIVIPPETVHSFTSQNDSEKIYMQGDMNQFFQLSSLTIVTDNVRSEGEQLAKMIYDNRHLDYEYVLTLFNAFAHFLLQRIKMDDKVFLAVKEIAEKISNNFYSSNIDLNSILKQSGYAEDYIRAHFKEIMGKTPTAFLTEIRINHACYLMYAYKSTLSLAEIAEKCGFLDYVYFSRRFKQVTGLSPREFMKNS